MIAHANSSKAWPYLNTKPETIKPIDHPKIIRFKKRKIKYKPKLNLENTIRLTIDWYDTYYKKKDIYNYSLKQLKNYFNK